MLTIIGLLLLATAFWIAYRLPEEYLRHIPKSLRNSIPRRKASTSQETKASTRKFGDWTAEQFTYPDIEPWTDFDIETTKPIPYRPFRWGPTYPINLGIGTMPWNHWLVLDNHYKRTIAIRKQRTEERGTKAHRTQPGFMPQAEECLSEICSFMAMRYPHCFSITHVAYNARLEGTWGNSIDGVSSGAVASITNKITGDFYDFSRLRSELGSSWDPMKYAGLLQQDDLAVMVEDENGEYRFQAGSICTAGFWRLEDKIGCTLNEIHTRGKVAQFETKLKFSMERFFQKQKVDAPVQRNNYFFQIDDQLSWSELTNGPEDIFDQATKGPVEGSIHANEFTAPRPTDSFDKVWFRTERQTLRRMPKTGCILFTIRTYLHPVREIVGEPGVPGRLADAIRSWPEDVNRYKGGELYKEALLPRLDALHAVQIKDGVVQLDADGEVVGRSVRTYPF